MAAEAAQVEEPMPLRLSCGHDVTAIQVDASGVAYCSACRELAGIAQEAAEDEDPSRRQRGKEDEEEQHGDDHGARRIDPDEADPETADVEAGEPLDEDGAGVHTHEAAVVADRAGEPRQDDSPPQPVYGTRSTVQGPRGCWATNKHGEPCGAVKRRDADFCTAHSGLGVASDPSRYSPLAHEARRQQLETRARLRLVLGDRGRVSARSVLREQANLNATRLAGRAIGAALSPEVDDAKAAGIALSIIREAEPRDQATLEIDGALTPESMDGLSFRELVALAQQHDISPASTPPELPA